MHRLTAMQVADIITATVRGVVSVTLLVGLCLGWFPHEGTAVLASLVALTTGVAAGQSVVHARTCEGHPNGKG